MNLKGIARNLLKRIDEFVRRTNIKTVNLNGNLGQEIQNAIDQLPEGGTINLEPKEYIIERTVLLHDNISLIGAGLGKTKLLLKDNSNCHVISNRDWIKGNKNLKISNLEIDGNMDMQVREDGKPISFCNGVYFKNAENVFIDKVEANNIFQTGLHFSGCTNVEIDNYSSRSVGWSGISTSGTDNIIIRHAYIFDSGRDQIHSGIHLDGGEGAFLQAKVEKCTGNSIMIDSKFAEMSNVVIDCVGVGGKRGLSLSGSGTNRLFNVYITGEYRDNREIGILVSNSENIVIRDCLIENNKDFGILMQGRIGAINCIVTQCRIKNNGVGVAEIHESRNNYVVLNNFFSNEKDVSLKMNNKVNRIEKGNVTNEKSDEYEGICSVCGQKGKFQKLGKSIRETYNCKHCRASLRQREQAAIIVKLFSKHNSVSINELIEEQEFQKVSIYEPGIAGPFRKYFKKLPYYTLSYYWDDVKEGDYKDNIQCQNLMKLTYPSNTFDLVITSEIFEHVRKPYLGFKEIFRVLKRGGIHVFTVPVQNPMPQKTVYRVDTSGDKDIYIMPPHYHIAGDGTKSLVYSEFGADMLEELEKIGFKTIVERIDTDNSNLKKLVTFYSVKP